MNKTKIMHLNDSLDVGGAERMILSLLSNIDTKHYEVSACSISSSVALIKEFEQENIPVYILNKGNGFDIKVIARLFNILKKEKIDILHTHNYYAWIYGGLATLFLPACKHVHTQHSNIVMPKPPAFLVKKLLSLIPKKVITVSDQVLDTLINNNYFTNRNKSAVICNGIDTQKFYPSDKSNDSERIIIGIVARLSEVKNHKLLINAVAKVCAENSNVSLKIVGDGPLNLVLKKQVKQLNAEDFIEFLGERNNISDILRSFDIFVLSSFSEGFSISILEAMSTALPVIATDVGGNSSNVTHNETGLLVQSDNVAKLSAALQKLISSKELRERYGNNGREKVVNLYSISKMVDDYQNIYLHI